MPQRKSAAAASATALSIRQVYRNLLRSIPPSVRFSRPASSNLRRLIRDDFRAQPLEQSQSASASASASVSRSGSDSDSEHQVISQHELHFKAQNTIALLLSSAYSPRPKIPSSTSATSIQSTVASGSRNLQPQELSHKLISNLCSLTYHHLSPNTRMQSMRRKTGGSTLNNPPSSTNSKSRSATKAKTSKSRLAFLGSQKIDEDSSEEGPQRFSSAAENSSQHLTSLLAPPKPIRGPVTSPSHPNWDGQNPYKTPNNLSPQDLVKLEEKVSHLAERFKAFKEKGEEDTKMGKEARKDFVELRGDLKSKRTQLLKENEASYRKKKPVGLLYDLVEAIEETENVWIGRTRWGKLKRDDWIEP